MKRKFVFITIIIVCLITIAAGIIIIKSIIGRKWDFVLPARSVSNDITLFEKVCSTEPEVNYGTKEYKATLSNPDDFYELYVKNNPSFIYSINSTNEQVFEETGVYLFLKDDYYFLIIIKNGYIYGTELRQGYYFEDGNVTNVPLPFIPEEDRTHGGLGYLHPNETAIYSWDDSPGINSFEDLVAYYSRINDIEFSVDYENKIITVLAFEFEFVNYSYVIGNDQVVIKCGDEEIEVTYIEQE